MCSIQFGGLIDEGRFRWLIKIKTTMGGNRGKKKKTPKKQGYVRDSGPKKRSPLSRLSIRNHLSPATSFTQWLMGLHRPRVPAHYLVHTGPLFKHKGRNMKHCFRCCLWVKKKFYLFWAWRRMPLDHFWSCAHASRPWPRYKLKMRQVSPTHRWKSEQLKSEGLGVLKKLWRCT